jgi:hypothetical protein
MALSVDADTDGMISTIDWVDSSVITEIDVDQTFSKTFSSDSDSRLQLKRLRRAVQSPGETNPPPYVWSQDVTTMVELQSQDVSTKVELEQSAVSLVVKEN